MQLMGISTFEDDDYNLATALGGMTLWIKPLEMAAAFNVLMKMRCIQSEANYVQKLEQVNGEVLYTKNASALQQKESHVEDTTATNMIDILERCCPVMVPGQPRLQIYTTAGKRERLMMMDLWFTGITGNLTTSVWHRTPENDVLYGGSSRSASIYGDYMSMVIDQDLLTITEMGRTSNGGENRGASSIDSGYSTTEKDDEEKRQQNQQRQLRSLPDQRHQLNL